MYAPEVFPPRPNSVAALRAERSMRSAGCWGAERGMDWFQIARVSGTTKREETAGAWAEVGRTCAS